VSLSVVDRLHLVLEGFLGVIVHVDSYGDFVNFDFQILDNGFFGLSSDEEVSVFQKSQISLYVV
jgi:hypothetical protein